MDKRLEILQGDCRTLLKTLPDESVQCVVTSPPYWGLRDYGVDGQIGLEQTPEAYVAEMVAVFREVRRVLRRDGTLWCNMGDSYYGGGQDGTQFGSNKPKVAWAMKANRETVARGTADPRHGLKFKDLSGIPWRLAFALQADGWYLRSDVIWHKPNPMPESVTDRPTKAHEYVFLLSKSPRYFYDAEAIKEPPTGNAHPRGEGVTPKSAVPGNGVKANESFHAAVVDLVSSRNKRTVWTVPTAPYSEAHFATFPPALIQPCILAGTSARGCCPKCGAPWERVTEVDRVPMDEYDGKYAEQDNRCRNLQRSLIANRRNGGEHDNPFPVPKTTGWRPTCQHGEDPSEARSPIPCTVLDPFGGSGTTGQVALELGRRAILIELNPEYVELAQRRCCVTMGLPL